MPKKVTREQLIKRAHTVHHSFYSYDAFVFTTTGDKSSIITCPVHGNFQQRFYSHLEGAGCPECSRDMRKAARQTSLINRAKDIHGDAYDYSNVQYTGPNNAVTIVCRKHGPFNMRLDNHVYGKQKCPLCGSGKKRTTDDFITLAKEVHGDTYDYSKSVYVNATTNVIIICKEHGAFHQTPDTHCLTYNQGCPKCKSSKGEKRIYNTLTSLGINNFVCEKSFDDLRGNVSGSVLRYDFFLPSHNILIEYDGQHHFKPVNFTGRIPPVVQEQALLRMQQNDAIKTQYAKDKGYELIRIPYTEYDNIEKILTEKLLVR